MLITKLQIAGLRSIKQAEFTFQPGMNLIVGVNGVGKTTVLGALAICLSRILLKSTLYSRPKLAPPMHSITVGMEAVQISCDFDWNGKPFNLLINKQRSKRVLNKDKKLVETPDVEVMTPDFQSLFPESKKSSEQPIGLFFTARRSLVVDREVAKASVIGGQAAAFVDSLLASRELNLRPIAEWFRAQDALGLENSVSVRHTEVLARAVSNFLPNFQNLRVVDSEEGSLFEIDKNGVPLQVNQLSEGERGVLAIVLDLARRLSQANPNLKDPVKDGVAVVLIDELDLHLHPKWQRSIVENLTRTFKKCQFIATTHSPQIIPAVEPERVQLIKDNEVITPDRTLGLDSNWILKFLMETGERPPKSDKAIKEVEDLINRGDYELAREAMINYRQEEGFDLPEWSMLEARVARLKLLKKK